MKKNTLDDFVKRNPLAGIGIAIGVILILILSGIIVYRQFSPKKSEKELVSVEFGDGENSVIVEKNGKVTIKTPYGVFTQNWDKEKVRKFFEDLEDLDFDKLSEYIGGDLAVTLTLGEEIIKISLEEDLIENSVDQMQEVLEETYEEERLGEYENYYDGGENQDGYLGKVDKDEEENEENEDEDSGSDDPWKTGNESDEDSETFKCEDIDPVTGKKVIISNTVCGK